MFRLKLRAMRLRINYEGIFGEDFDIMKELENFVGNLKFVRFLSNLLGICFCENKLKIDSK